MNQENLAKLKIGLCELEEQVQPLNVSSLYIGLDGEINLSLSNKAGVIRWINPVLAELFEQAKTITIYPNVAGVSVNKDFTGDQSYLDELCDSLNNYFGSVLLHSCLIKSISGDLDEIWFFLNR